MNKVRKKIVIYAEVAIFVLVSLLIAAINVINFAAVADDADHITGRIASASGSFPGKEIKNAQGRLFPQMGPDSPEMEASTRYFTFSYDSKGNGRTIEFQMSSLTEDEAMEWAKGLIPGDNGEDALTGEKKSRNKIHDRKELAKGWTRVTYRYRVYKDGDWTYVTVIDQSRELSPSYRMLFVSIGGELAVLVLCLFILLAVSRRLFAPLEEANRKQEKFIANIEQDFKLPLTLINANTEIIEKERGASTEQTKAINGQVRKMTRLVKRLSTLSIYENKNTALTRFNFSDVLSAALDSHRENFAAKGIRLDVEIAPDIFLNGDEEAMRKVCGEIIDNALKFSEAYAIFSLEKQADRIVLKQRNDTGLPDGVINQVFDRFTTLENAVGSESAGLGLSYVKDVAKRYSGRVGAVVENQVFELTVDL